MKLPNFVNNDSMVDEVIAEQKKSMSQYHIVTDENDTEPMYQIPEDLDKFNEAKYVKYIERIVRTSSEYKNYVQTIKREFNLNGCKFYDGIDLDETPISLELHHYPATLFDIVSAVRTKMEEINPRAPYESFKIAEEVTRLHYEGLVGLVPLSKTIHDLAHNGHIFIPLTDGYVFGDYEKLIEDSKDTVIFDDEFDQKYKAIKQLTEEFIETGENPTTDKLNIREVTVEMTSSESPMKINKVEELYA